MNHSIWLGGVFASRGTGNNSLGCARGLIVDFRSLCEPTYRLGFLTTIDPLLLDSLQEYLAFQ